MIESILSFSLKSVMYSAVFVAYYMLVLKNSQMNGFNRIYLLAAALLSLVLPFAKIELFNIAPVKVPDFPVLNMSAKATGEIATEATGTAAFNWQMLLIVVYFTITIVMILRMIVKSLLVYNLKKKGQLIRKEGFILVKTDDPRAPFSFMNMLFWPTHMRQDSHEGKGIMLHELTHIRQHHTVDKMLMQLMLAACWLNPFNWLIKKELWLQHEFLADKDAIKDRDTEIFARMLLYGVTNSYNSSLISPFFQSPVKRRLMMLAKPAKGSYSFLRRFLSIPVLMMTVLLISANTDKSTNIARSSEEIVLVLDAAHGGENHGGESIYGHLEKDITLAVCRKLVALSAEYNIRVVSTRNEDVNYSMEQRLKTINSTNDAIFISVHVNKCDPNSVQYNDYELGVNPKGRNFDKSILLASSIADKFKIQNLSFKVVDGGKAYLMRDNKHPALLLECGNIDNADNMALLTDNTRTEVLCRNILSGIVDYNARLKSKK